ncbi:MAG TPA: hypothetical protein VJ023_08780 [Pyrinomonadaceae bacterium]|nr:hypothetical protein [Pyrinomonadaceae bacterium]
MPTPMIVGVGGFCSNVGKTTLMCDLLELLPGWEAIKTTKGHYRSCGKTAHTCCVSHLLSDEPTVYSGRQQTYECGKDTGRYWDAGAANVHWVIATEQQIGAGINMALQHVSTPGVLIEGNSFSQHVNVHFLIMVTDGKSPMKKSARTVLPRCKALYISSPPENNQGIWMLDLPDLPGVPIFHKPDLQLLVKQIRNAGVLARIL